MNERGSEGNLDQIRIAGREISRRGFLAGISIAMGALGTILIGVPMVGFLLNPLLKRVPDEWRPVGNVDDFSVGETTSVVLEDASPLPWAGVTARTAAWLRRDSQDKFTAFSVNCTHLGCPVRWLDDAHLFMCPCHGGVYYQDGSVAAGPPPKSLIEYPVRIQDGRVEIRTSPLPIT
ncbi:MAG: ubiquinol-cytochrome c reductase iron-sulfur subunit [Anaerolineales bacterium]